MRITAELFEAYLKCSTKCWLRATGEPDTGHPYPEWVKSQNEFFRATETERLLAETPESEAARTPCPEYLKTGRWQLAVDVAVATPALLRIRRREAAQVSVTPPTILKSAPSNQSVVTSAAPGNDDDPHSANGKPEFAVESLLHAVERVPCGGRGRGAQFIPIRFELFNKVSQDDRLLLAFDAYVLSAALGREIAVGKIIHGDGHATLKMKTSALAGEVRRCLVNMAALLSSPAPPDLVLNRHCAECEFQTRCRQKALECDDLSLLAGMSEKERHKLRSKGIFSVTQLSYTFRPRRRPKRFRDKREKYHHSLKALAIREKKVHIVGRPELRIEGTPVYLDVEGLPDHDFHYLLGLRIRTDRGAVHHSHWVNTQTEERKLWEEFLAILESVERPVLIHYGSFETTFLKRMIHRYGNAPEGSPAAIALLAPTNLLSAIFAQVYFPTYSNTLKEAASWLGFAWSDPALSGPNSVACRVAWEQSPDPTLKERLITYNTEDCEALEKITNALVRVARLDSASQPIDILPAEVVHVDSLPREDTRWHPFSSPIPEFEHINRAARWDYQRDRVRADSDGLR